MLKVLSFVLGALFIVFFAAGLYLYGLYEDLPALGELGDSTAAARTSFVYAADGSVIAEFHGEEDRTFVAVADMPRSLRDAVVSIEDERFYQHKGVDVEAIMRALRSDVEAGAYVQGGSTITQQLVKMMTEESERTLARKLKEALLAYQLEAQTEKDRVLEAYLNLAYFGHGWYGAEAAAQNYFGKSASDLTLTESATLAAIIRSPGTYSPIADPEAARDRRDLVLSKMEERGYITASGAIEARAEELELASPRQVPRSAPYFVEFVKQDLIDRLGADAVFAGGLRIKTSLDPRLQAMAEAAAKGALPGEDDPEVALVSLDHRTGRVLALVGGRDYAENQFNLAVQSKRQPGSAFKPFVLASALERGVSPSQLYDTSPYTVDVTDGTWHVENYEGAFPVGRLTLEDATVYSVNAVYARLIMEVGPERVVEVARRMGITSQLEPNPAIALGGLTEGVSPLEMASAYGSVATGGIGVTPTGIVEVVDSSGNVLYRPENGGTRVLDEDVAVSVSRILHEVVERGTGQAAKFEQWAAGKTGTTQSYRDAWFVGYSGDLVTAVWVGYPQAQVAMEDVHGRRVSGGSFPAEVWRSFMSGATKVVASAPAPSVPDDAVEDAGDRGALVRICVDSFGIANERCTDVIELYLKPDQVPADVCGIH